jgi:hypothetical protein
MIEIILSALAIIVAFVSLYFAIHTIKKSNETKEIQVVGTVLSNIQDHTMQLIKEKEKIGDGYDNLKDLSDGVLLNPLEYYCSLINDKLMVNKKTLKYFNDAIPPLYETFILGNTKIKDDENQYPELRKFYRNLKQGKKTLNSHRRITIATENVKIKKKRTFRHIRR